MKSSRYYSRDQWKHEHQAGLMFEYFDADAVGVLSDPVLRMYETYDGPEGYW